MTAPLEFCHEWIASKADRCNEPAAVIIWGKLMNPEALGPKCNNHAVHYIGDDYYSPRLSNWAVFDLRGLIREEVAP